ncbi:hypothetical protein SC206_19115 [Rouxiella sp. T17]|uniref:hypothetical protein n=1 Tax=Rouxiella sp. T17 TaxID=3085684 RepID=UPI002FC99D87
MDLTTISLIATIAIGIWTIYRDRRLDSVDIDKRITQQDTNYLLLKAELKQLQEKQADQEQSLKKLEESINILNLNVQKILTILEKP